MRFYKYTPALLSPETIEQTLIGRDFELKNLQRILKSVASGNSCSHAILIGPKGIGKSHLLQLIYHGVAGSINGAGLAAYRDKFIPVIFPEEEYPGNITKLIKLILHYLSHKTGLTLPPIPDVLTATGILGEKAKEAGIDYIKKFRKKTGKILLLLVDNLNDIIERFTEEDQATLRELLITCDSLLLIGAAPTLFDSIINHDKPLYNFFEVIWLKDLSFEDSVALLKRYAELDGKKDIEKELQDKEAKLRAIYELAGGNPRLLLSLYHIIAERDLSSVEDTFLKVLDELSPYFRERMKDLSEQQQEIIDTMAKSEMLLTPTEIAGHCHMPVNIVNAQLKRLEKNGYVKVAKKHSKKAFYDFNERLFSLWRQMRVEAGRKRLGFIVKLLEIWFTKDELFEYLDKTLGAIREKITAGLAEAKPFVDRLWYIKEAISEFKGFDEAYAACQRKEYDVAISLLREELKENSKNQMARHNLGLVYIDLKRYEDALRTYEEITQAEPNNADAWNNIGTTYYKLKKFEDAIQAYKKAVQIKPDKYGTWNNLAAIYSYLNQFEDAVEAYKMVAHFNPGDYDTLFNLGFTYGELKHYEDALEYYKKAAKIKPNIYELWHNIGIAYYNLKRYADAQKAYEKVLQIKPDDGDAWNSLGAMCGELKHLDEAIEAFRRSLEIKIDNKIALDNLLLAFKKAIEQKRVQSLKIALEKMESADQANLLALLSPFSVLLKYLETRNTEIIDRLRNEDRLMVEDMMKMLNEHNVEKGQLEKG